MKRFHSPIQKIQKVTAQRVKLQQLKLSQINREVLELKQRVSSIEVQIDEVESETVHLMKTAFNPTAITSIQTVLDRMRGSWREAVNQVREIEILQHREAQELAELSARESALNKLLDRQLVQHRNQNMKDAQIELDENFILSHNVSFTSQVKGRRS